MNEQEGYEHLWEVSCCLTSSQGSRSKNGDLLGQQKLEGLQIHVVSWNGRFFPTINQWSGLVC